MQVSAFFFGDAGQATASEQYSMVLDVARTADRVGLDALWLPERHFHPFGGPFPNPAVLAAAVASATDRLRIRAGSVVLPLHHPVRVAEEWAAVDALSGGRVDLAFATGWNPNDFVLAPSSFVDRRSTTIDLIAVVKRLWEGEAVKLPNGLGEPFEVRTFPRPVQPTLSTWLTCTASSESFEAAGSAGLHVLTALLHQTAEELAVNLGVYRGARREAGWPDDGHVTLMLHTFVGTDPDAVRRLVRAPLVEYLTSSADLWGVSLPDLARMSPKKRKLVMDLAVSRYVRTAGLIGSADECLDRLVNLAELGVDEVACLVDFGLSGADVIEGIENLGAVASAHRAGHRR